jgi:hypothetical protein
LALYWPFYFAPSKTDLRSPGLVLFFAFDTARKHIPDDKQRVDFKVRLQYKLSEKYQQLVTKSPDGRSNTVVGLIQSEVNPLMDKVNELLELDPEERELFLTGIPRMKPELT